MNVNKWGPGGWVFLHTITFNYPPISFNKIVKSNKNKLLPKKTTYLEPKIVTGLIISSLK